MVLRMREVGGHLEIFADADCASKAPDRRSVSGGVVMCRDAAVSWLSVTRKCVTLSTTEVEYVARVDAVKDAIFMRHVWSLALPSRVVPPMNAHEDKQRAVHLVKNTATTSNSKHGDMRHRF